jgi:hypothetical protein
MDSPVTDHTEGAWNALIIGVVIAVAGVGVLLWVVRLSILAVYRTLRSRIRAAKNTDDSGIP